MASFSSSTNQSFYKKHLVDKAFQNLLEESMRYECPVLKKMSDSSDLNLSSIRADLFTSIKLNQNPIKWRKDLKKKSKIAQKLNRSRQTSGYQFKKPGLRSEQEIQISEDNFPSTSQQSSLQPFFWKQPSFVSGTKTRASSNNEFVIPEVPNHPPTKRPSNKVRTFSGSTLQMEPASHSQTQSKQRRTSKHRGMNEAADRNYQLSKCRVVLEKCPENVLRDERKKMSPAKIKKEKVKDVANNKNYVFDHWIFRIDENDNVFVKGHLSGSPANVFWSTSEIVKRLDRKTLLTASGKMCILEGPLMKNALISKGYPADMLEKFSNGFPSNWKLYSKQLLKLAVQQKESKHRTIKKEYVVTENNDVIEEEDEEEEGVDDDNDVEEGDDDDDDFEDELTESEEKAVPKSQKPSVIKENSKIPLAEKNAGNGQDYLFGIFSQDARTQPAESGMRPRSVRQATKKAAIEMSKKPVKTEPLQKDSNPENLILTRSKAKSLRTNVQSEAAPYPKSAAVLENPVSPRQMKKMIKTGSPHPLSNAISGVSTKSTKKRVSSSNNKTPAVKISSPVKPSKVKKSKTSSNKKKASPLPKSQKVDAAKKMQTGSKKTVQSKKRKQSEEKRIKDWTKEEVQKLLAAMSTVPKSDPRFWQKVSRKVGRTYEECANYYCSCDFSNLDWKDLKKKDEKKEEPNQKKKLHIYDVSDSYEDDLFELDNFLGHTKKIRLNQDHQLDTIFADLSVKTSSSSEQNFQTPMSKFFLSPVSERHTPASNFSDGDVKIDWDNADRCVNEFKKKQKKGAGRLRLTKKLADLKTEFKPKSLQLGSLVNELNKINDIPDRLDDTGESNQYFSSESEE